MSRRLLAVSAALLASIAYAPSAEASQRKSDFPCAGCVTLFPDLPAYSANGLAPLLVVLHGDGEGPMGVLVTWEKAAMAKGVVLFAPKCPAAEGCKASSWWQWAGPTSWFDDKIKAIDAVVGIDDKRTFIAGWSGGASYLGWSAPDLAGRFAALSIDGGGMPPDDTSKCPRCPLPTYFLVGDKNPLHAIAKDLHAYIAACERAEDVTWDLVAGANHAGEWAALGPKTGPILDWFLAHPLDCAPDVLPAPSTIVETTPSTPPEAPAKTSDPPAVVSKNIEPSGPPPARCSCDLAGDRDGAFSASIASACAIAFAIIRRVGGGRTKGKGPRRACRGARSDR